MGPLTLPVIVVLVAVGIAAMTDLRAFKIHNLLTIPLLLTGLAYHAAVGGMDGFKVSLAGAGFGFGVLFLFYLIGGVGGGDIKLLAGIGAWLGIPLTGVLVLAASILGGVYAVFQITMSGRAREAWTNIRILGYRLVAVGRHLSADDRVEDVVRRDDCRARAVPFGVMIGVGLVLLMSVATMRPSRRAIETPLESIPSLTTELDPAVAQSPTPEAGQ